ncbi:fibulin-2 isoform X3 [Haemorhous mexicanus]|uniref:fibulin-2 isoform X3 n=1 Tax=Haemorhous mexicanus TaxID=30427 RepID=UPI0028BF4120|nr:fibulin-2 isoform X3 [Haemorhous mexicanus]
MARAWSWQQSPWNALLLVLLWSGGCQAQRDCTGAACQVLENCIEDVLEPGECCATCLQHGCTCEGYQYYDCVNVGFINGKVPEGQSYFVDFGSTECSCPKGGGKISCQFMLCPELPPNCIDAVVPADGCPQCGRIGCLHEGQKYVAGHTFHMPPCKVCHCPNAGGELMCYQLPDCNTFSLNTASPGDAEDGEPERHYDDPYSYDQEASEGDNTQVESPKKYRSYSSHLEHESLSQEQGEDYDYPAASVAPSAPALADPHTEGAAAPSTTPVPRGPAKARGATERGERRRVPRTTAPSLQQVTRKEAPATTRAPAQHTTATTEAPQHLEELERRPKGNKERHEQERAPHSKMKKHARKEEPENSMYQGLKEVNFTELSSARSSHEGLEGNDFPKVKFSATTSPPVALKEDRSQSSPKQSQTLYRYHPEEDGDPNSIHANPRLPEGSTKELIESCCGAGQQWAIDNGECTEIPVSGMDGDICRIAQKQCCVSTVRENSCLAGMVAAKEGDSCGPEDSDPCAGSSYKQCCDCCSLGLRLRSEGKTCESNINLGYPCSHVMLSCCEGGDHFVHPEIRRHPEPVPTVTPEKVSEREDHHEALSISSEAELSNNLPGDDLDECLLYGGELCQHLCINTVGSYKCSCFPEFTLQEDGTSCSPDPDRGPMTRLEAEATIPPVASPSQPILVVSLQEEQDKCKDNGPCKHLCNIVEGDAVCSCMAGYTLMADGVSCEDINECVTERHTCQRREHCVNTMGSFRCLQELSCQPGHELKDGECVDIDECQRGTHSCKVNFVCQNTEGSFYCESKQRCMDGFLQDPEGNCVDINECTSLPEPCKPGFNCINTVGSYTCQRNMLSCSRGYHSNEEGTRCVDVNECDNSPCSQECANVYGSYQCYCRQGFQLAEDGHSCKDIDECAQSAGILCTFRCVNVPGSYQCACPEQGYTVAASGRTCRDIDECAIGSHNCSAAETCYNIQGSFRCLSFECPSNYRKVSDMRCERISCFNYLECQNTPVRITYYQLNFQTNIVVPAHIFRIGPSPAYAGDSIALTITSGNEEGFFSTRRLNAYTGIVYLQRQVKEPKDFLLDVEMKLWRQGTYTTFLAKIYIFITAHAY